MPYSTEDFVTALVPLHFVAEVVAVARGQFYNLGASVSSSGIPLTGAWAV